MSLENLLVETPGRIRQVSSYGKAPASEGAWAGLVPGEALQKRIRLEPGATQVLADLEGPGIIRRLWVTLFPPASPGALRNLVLRFFWDGELGPSVESPLGDFFGAPFGRYVGYRSEPLSLTGGGFNSFWPMPFGTSARLEVINRGHRAVDPFFYQITYYQLEEAPPSGLRFHAHWQRENPTRPDRPYTILEAQGRGHYVGCNLSLQNREWWLRPPLRAIVFPRGFGMGMLEGWETIRVDGDANPAVKGTGTEDYFGAGFYYYRDGKFCAPYHGCTVRDYLRGRVAAYRYDILHPVPFSESIQVTIDHGLDNCIQGDYASVAYWYQREPHRENSGISNPLTLAPASPKANMAQMLALLGIPALVGAFIIGLVGRLLKR